MPGILISQSIKGFSGDMPMNPVNKFTITWVDGRASRHQAQVEVSRRELQDPRVVMLVINDAASIKKAWFQAGAGRR